MSGNEKEPLLSRDPPSYASGSGIIDDTPWYASYGCLYWLYEHRTRIPGYGLLKLIKQARPYSLYVLFILLLVYLLNQLDRYTISITSKYVGLDLQFGDLDCMPNMSVVSEYGLPRSYFVHTLMKECNKNKTLKHNETYCEEYEFPVPYNETVNVTTTICAWDHDGSAGIDYQVLAGPVFNNIYPLAGILMGILADRFNRKLMLGLSLLFWSVATGVTGFALNYWMLVVFRFLLAIGAAGCSPFALSLIADYFPQELRGTAIGIYYWGIYTGYSLAYALGNEINIALNWNWVFFISGIMGVALTPFVLFTVKEPQRKKDEKKVQAAAVGGNDCLALWEKAKLVFKTFFMPGMITLCIAGSIRNAGGYVWAYNTEPFFLQTYDDDVIAVYMSVIPLVGGSVGAVVGGLISDVLVKNRGPYARIWVLIISQLLAAPFAAGALFLPYPWCFLTLIPSNVIGEMWVGVLSAIIVDITPSSVRTTVIAVYLFIITFIGGNTNIIVDPLMKAFNKGGKTMSHSAMQWSLFLTFPCFYALSSLLFVVAFFLMRIDIKMKKKREGGMSLNRPVKSGSIDSNNE